MAREHRGRASEHWPAAMMWSIYGECSLKGNARLRDEVRVVLLMGFEKCRSLGSKSAADEVQRVPLMMLEERR